MSSVPLAGMVHPCQIREIMFLLLNKLFGALKGLSEIVPMTAAPGQAITGALADREPKSPLSLGILFSRTRRVDFPYIAYSGFFGSRDRMEAQR